MRASSPQFAFDGPVRSRRIVVTFLVGAAALVGVTTWLTIQLTTRAVEERIESELGKPATSSASRGSP